MSNNNVKCTQRTKMSINLEKCLEEVEDEGTNSLKFISDNEKVKRC